MILELMFDHCRHGIEEAEHLYDVVGIVAQIGLVACDSLALQKNRCMGREYQVRTCIKRRVCTRLQKLDIPTAQIHAQILM